LLKCAFLTEELQVSVSAYQHSPVAGLFGKDRFIEETVFENAALEFGAGYICR